MLSVWKKTRLFCLNINSGVQQKMSNCAVLFTIIIASIFSTSAFAEYKYVYTGNIFTTTATTIYREYPPPYDVNIVTYDTNISVSFASPNLLAGPGELSNELPFIIGLKGDLFIGDLPYPYPYPPDPASGQGSPSNPYYDGLLKILAVDSQGLPTDWDIAVSYYYAAPTGRWYGNYMRSSTNLDTAFGGYEGFYDYLGELNNNPGTWIVMAVPEPESYAMLLAGLGLIGFSIKRHRA